MNNIDLAKKVAQKNKDYVDSKISDLNKDIQDKLNLLNENTNSIDVKTSFDYLHYNLDNVGENVNIEFERDEKFSQNPSVFFGENHFPKMTFFNRTLPFNGITLSSHNDGYAITATGFTEKTNDFLVSKSKNTSDIYYSLDEINLSAGDKVRLYAFDSELADSDVRGMLLIKFELYTSTKSLIKRYQTNGNGTTKRYVDIDIPDNTAYVAFGISTYPANKDFNFTSFPVLVKRDVVKLDISDETSIEYSGNDLFSIPHKISLTYEQNLISYIKNNVGTYKFDPELIYNNLDYVTPEMFGFNPEGQNLVVDDYLLAAIATGKNVKVRHDCKLTKQITVKSNQTITFDANVTVNVENAITFEEGCKYATINGNGELFYDKTTGALVYIKSQGVMNTITIDINARSMCYNWDKRGNEVSAIEIVKGSGTLIDIIINGYYMYFFNGIFAHNSEESTVSSYANGAKCNATFRGCLHPIWCEDALTGLMFTGIIQPMTVVHTMTNTIDDYLIRLETGSLFYGKVYDFYEQPYKWLALLKEYCTWRTQSSYGSEIIHTLCNRDRVYIYDEKPITYPTVRGNNVGQVSSSDNILSYADKRSDVSVEITRSNINVINESSLFELTPNYPIYTSSGANNGELKYTFEFEELQNILTSGLVITGDSDGQTQVPSSVKIEYFDSNDELIHTKIRVKNQDYVDTEYGSQSICIFDSVDDTRNGTILNSDYYGNHIKKLVITIECEQSEKEYKWRVLSVFASNGGSQAITTGGGEIYGNLTIHDGDESFDIKSLNKDLGTLEDITREMNNEKANIESPELIGIPTAPTAILGTRTQQIATTEYVQMVADNLMLSTGNAAQIIININPIVNATAVLTNTTSGNTFTGVADSNGIITIVVNEHGVFNISYQSSGAISSIRSITIDSFEQIYYINATYVIPKTYTAIIDLANSNPLTCITYDDDATEMQKGSNDWDNQIIFKDINPCVFKNGQVVYYLDKNNFNFKTDGTPAILDGTDGDVMIEFPKFAYRIYKDNKKIYVSITNDPAVVDMDNRYHYYAFSKNAEGDVDHFYLGAYKGSLDANGDLASVIGKTPAANKTIGAFKTLAQNRGTSYTITSFFQLTAIQCLYIIKYGNLNGQSAIGQGITGRTNSSSTTYAYAPDITGGSVGYETADKGMNYGTNDSINTHVKVFGIEDFWGNILEWIDGLTIDSSRNIITNWDYDKIGNNNDFSFPSGLSNKNLSGWVKDVAGTTEAGFMNILYSGSSTTYFCDFGYLYADCVLAFGGPWDNGAYAGPFLLRAYYSASIAFSSIGARLMYL